MLKLMPPLLLLLRLTELLVAHPMARAHGAVGLVVRAHLVEALKAVLKAAVAKVAPKGVTVALALMAAVLMAVAETAGGEMAAAVVAAAAAAEMVVAVEKSVAV
jgi:hypothetical protein